MAKKKQGDVVSASFFERMLQIGDYENDGGVVDCSVWMPLILQLYADDQITLATAGALPAINCTPAQLTELGEILNTRPASQTARQSWAIKTGSILFAGQMQVPGFYSVNELRQRLGLPTI